MLQTIRQPTSRAGSTSRRAAPGGSSVRTSQIGRSEREQRQYAPGHGAQLRPPAVPVTAAKIRMGRRPPPQATGAVLARRHRTAA